MTELSYFSYTRPDSLSVAMNSSVTSVSLTDGATFPDPAAPGIGTYTVLVGYGTDREEVCTVTAKPTGNILTVTRGEDGTLATAKNLGDIVVHGVSARDFNTFATAKPPLAHAATHATAGSDRVTPASIGAAASPHATTHAPGGTDRLIPTNTFMRVKRTSDYVVGAGGFIVVPMQAVEWSKGADLTFTAGGLTVVNAGFYLLGIALHATSLDSGVTQAAFIRVQRGVTAPRDILAAGLISWGTGAQTLTGSLPWELQAADAVTAVIYQSMVGEGGPTTLVMESSLWAVRIG